MSEIPIHVLQAVDAELARGFLTDPRAPVPWTEQNAARRALTYAIKSGAVSPVAWVGAGVTGTVLRDARDRAFKVANRNREQTLAKEARWFAAAQPVLGDRVARIIDYFPGDAVLVREHVERVGSQPVGDELEDLCWEIDSVMRPHGWGAPECKPDSFVRAARGPVLVDGGFADERGPLDDPRC